MSEFGNRLRDLLAERGLQQQDLAHDLRIPESLVSAWVAGRRKPDKYIGKLADYFQVPVSTLRGWRLLDDYTSEERLAAALEMPTEDQIMLLKAVMAKPDVQGLLTEQQKQKAKRILEGQG